jgi:Ca-activated chloride channel family protein
VALAKKHGIATPYTSLLVVPDQAAPATVARPTNGTYPSSQGVSLGVNFNYGGSGTSAPPASIPAPSGPNVNWPNAYKNHGYAINTGAISSGSGTAAPPAGGGPGGRTNYAPTFVSPMMQWAAPVPQPCSTPCTSIVMGEAAQFTGNGVVMDAPAPPTGGSAPTPPADLKTGKCGVEIALQLAEMRNQSQVGEKLVRYAWGRPCVDLGGIWADEGFRKDMKQVTLKAMGAAYFRLLERQPQMKEVFQLGKRVVWVTPCGKVLVIDPDKGAEKMTDAEIDALFVAKK